MKLRDLARFPLEVGGVLRLHPGEPQGRGDEPVELLVAGLGSGETISLVFLSGPRAGYVHSVLPEECRSVGGGLSLDWLEANWRLVFPLPWDSFDKAEFLDELTRKLVDLEETFAPRRDTLANFVTDTEFAASRIALLSTEPGQFRPVADVLRGVQANAEDLYLGWFRFEFPPYAIVIIMIDTQTFRISFSGHSELFLERVWNDVERPGLVPQPGEA